MLILILIDVQYLHNVSFSFEKGSNGQNRSMLDPHYSIKKLKICPVNFQKGDCPPYPLLTLFGKHYWLRVYNGKMEMEF